MKLIESNLHKIPIDFLFSNYSLLLIHMIVFVPMQYHLVVNKKYDALLEFGILFSKTKTLKLKLQSSYNGLLNLDKIISESYAI